MNRYNIYLRRDGRWEGRISKGRDKLGKRKYKYIFGRTKEEVIDKINNINKLEKNNNQCMFTMGNIFKEWFSSVKYRLKESTSANYQMKANKHILPFFGKKMISNMTSKDIENFITEKQEQGLSSRYISDIIVLIKSIFRYASKKFNICSPADGICLPKKRNPEIRLLDDKEQKKLQKYVSNNQNNTTLGIALTMTTGIRIGELCALQWQDIDLKKRILTVRKTVQRIQCPTDTTRTRLIITEPKSESSKRQIPIPDCVINMLKNFRGKDHEYLLSNTSKPIEPRTMQYRFSRILNNENLPSVHFHALRHIFASNCVKLGFDIKSLSEILGHSSVEITLNRYVHSSFEQKRKYMKRIELNF